METRLIGVSALTMDGGGYVSNKFPGGGYGTHLRTTTSVMRACWKFMKLESEQVNMCIFLSSHCRCQDQEVELSSGGAQ